MPASSTLLLFAGAALVLLVVPGPAVLYIVTRSAAQGRGAGLASVAGVHTGTVVHIIAALVGLSALIAASATAFTTIKVLGAGYLVWLGITTLRTDHEPDDVVIQPARTLRRIYVDGVVLNVLNPKTAIFFLAFVPQFVDPAAGDVHLQLAVLGATFVGLGLISDAVYAMAGATIGARLRRSSAARRRTRRLSGAIYLGLGAVTALSGGLAE